MNTAVSTTSTADPVIPQTPTATSTMALPAFAQFDMRMDGNLGPRWRKWLDCFERLTTAMAVSEPTRMRALLLHYAGHEVDELFDTLIVSEVTDDVNVYQTAANALTDYFTPKTNTAFEIYSFRQATQGETETIDNYATRLRKLAKSCDFANVDREVANQIIFACQSKPLRRCALRDDLSLDKLIAAARALKRATSKRRRRWDES